jgi:DNA invertase Pin-like site-specific DNA recombinase
MSDFQRRVTIIPAKPQAMQQELKRQLRVAAYCRVSTEEEEQQSSYEAQCSYYTDKIMTNPEWTMAGIFADEGITGTSTKRRDEFNRMIRKCRQKKIDLILTKSISRFARNTVDCLKYVRALRELGIGIYFEKENINTLDMDTELILTFMGAFAQSESESISANVKWGKKQAMKEGKVNYPISRLYGYTTDENGSLVIHEDQAEVVRRIYTRYLRGHSIRMIRDGLNTECIPAKGGKEWCIGAVHGILTNEKYCGDVLMQKTFKTDVMTGKVVKNTGQLPMYLIQNNHPAIINRETYQAVQTEIARRSAGKSPSTKNAPTGRSCYSSKYALSERLVCGECGTRYQRCTWHRKNKVRVVWRCVSRVEFGTKYCKESPTMDEEPLQQAILDAINSVMGNKTELSQLITDTMVHEVITVPKSSFTLGEIQRRLQELESEFSAMLKTAQSNDIEASMKRYQEIKDEMASLKEQREVISDQLRKNAETQERIRNTTIVLDNAVHHITKWEEDIIRQLVHTVKVISATHIKVTLYDGTEIHQEVNNQ